MTAHDPSEPPVLGSHRGFEVYPMPVFAGLETADVDALIEWYRAVLGFAPMFRMPPAGQAVLVHLRRRKYQDILVRPRAPGSPAPWPGGWSLCLDAGEDVDELARRAATVPLSGQARIEPPVNTPWNTRQLRITDPEGRLLVLSQPRFDPELTENMLRHFAADRESGR